MTDWQCHLLSCPGQLKTKKKDKKETKPWYGLTEEKQIGGVAVEDRAVNPLAANLVSVCKKRRLPTCIRYLSCFSSHNLQLTSFDNFAKLIWFPITIKTCQIKQWLKIFKLSDLSRDEEDWRDKQTNTIRDGGNTTPTTAYCSHCQCLHLPSYIAILLELNGKIASTLLCYISLSSGCRAKFGRFCAKNPHFYGRK